jgi:folate-binding protein YgfZ
VDKSEALTSRFFPTRKPVRTVADVDGSSNYVCIMHDLATVVVRGDDAETFLQGQLTNDVTQLKDSCQLNAWCNPKGRVVTILKLWCNDDGISMQLPRSLAEPVIKRMQMYILRSHVTLEDCSDGIATAGLAGPVSKEWLATSLGEPPEPGQSAARGKIVINCPVGTSERYLVTGSSSELEEMLKSFPDEIPICDANTWTRIDIHDGIPEIWPETTEKYIPQSLNLDLLGAISFNKGCYTGQEVVARTHYLGTPKQRMYKARTASGSTARDTMAPGSKLYLPGNAEQSVGSIVSSFNTGDVQELLVSAKLHARGNKACHVHGTDGPEISLGDLPYTMNL